MKLSKITLRGFRSYSTEQSLDLTALPAGFYHVAGSNGAGKSTLFDAVCWTMFGETSRGLRAGTIKSWGAKAKDCECSIVLDGALVTRSWNPNRLSVDGVEVEQKSLETALQLTPEVALNTFYFSQFSDFFLDLKPQQRMEIYSSVLGLELWEHKSELASKLAKDFNKDAQRLEVDEARLRERAATLLATDLSKAKTEWQQGQAKKLKALEDEATIEAAKLEKEEQKFKAWEAKQVGIKAQLKAGKKEQEEKLARLELLKTSAGSAQWALKQAQADVTEAATALKEFKTLGGNCPKCAQPVPKDHAAKHIKELEKEALAAKGREAKATREAKEAADQATLQAEAYAKADTSKLTTALNNAEVEARSAFMAMQSYHDQLRKLVARGKEISREPNPFEQQQKANAAAALKATKDADKVKAELSSARGHEAAFQFWTKAFKDIRFQVLKESLAQLNAEVNECVHDLGLEGWQMEFEVEKETKSGTVKRGFLCSVLSPDSPDSVPWEAWSGGESQRLRLAAQMGVSNMIASRLGINPDFEFWDEPSTHLNDEGIKDMLAVLQERAQRYQRRIFLADHRALDFDFDGVLTVVKTDTGSILTEVQT